jgi:hypothetical protein
MLLKITTPARLRPPNPITKACSTLLALLDIENKNVNDLR